MKYFLALIMLFYSANVHSQTTECEHVPAGGAKATNTTYTNWGAFGQPTASVVTGGNYTNQVGFFYRATPSPAPATVWVSSTYTSGAGNDGHTWNYTAFSGIQDALNGVAENGRVVLEGNFYFGTDLTLSDGKKLVPNGCNIYIDGHIVCSGGCYIDLSQDGYLIMPTASSQTFTVGTPELGPCPVVITAPASNTFSVGLVDENDQPFVSGFYSRCMWDIQHTGGSDPADIDFVYAKANIGPDMPDPMTVCYILSKHGTRWNNLTGNGAPTVDNWDGNSNFYVSSVTGVTQFSLFGPNPNFAIPTLTEWAAIALGGLLIVFSIFFIRKQFII